MNVLFNGEQVSLDTPSCLADVLAAKQLLDKTGIAVAVNQQVVPKAQWSNFSLTNNDNILVITATQGG